MSPLDLLPASFEILSLVTAFLITTSHNVKGIIRSYQLQSFLLAFITGTTALKRLLEGGQEINFVVTLIALIVCLPLSLAISIEPLLVRATITVPATRFTLDKEQRRTAEYVWLERDSKRWPVIATMFFLGLIALASGIAFLAIPAETGFELPERIGLFISLSLYLIGLYNTSTKDDIISQVIGLLMMDHGLYLAVVKIVAIPVPATFFVVGLYFYTLITIAILVFIVPQVSHKTAGIDLDEIANSSKLDG